MGLSETILAAMIGAVATVSAALFQIYTSFRQRGKVDTRPKKGSASKSVLAVLSLMVASAAGGFLYSELIKQRAGEDMRAMRQELKDLTALIAEGKHKARETAFTALPPPAAVDVSMETQSGAASAESVVYVPACRRSEAAGPCVESDAQRIALCGTVPAYARVERINLFVQPDAVQHPWDQHRAELDQDLGGARFTGQSFEYAQGQDLKAVCVNFMHWSSDNPHIARIQVEYRFGAAAEPIDAHSVAPAEAVPVQAPAVIAADTLPAAMPQAASLSTSVAAQ
jgi:hypothetical protein